jgi:hypothetical protein
VDDDLAESVPFDVPEQSIVEGSATGAQVEHVAAA